MAIALLILPAGPLLAWKRGDVSGVLQRLWVAALLAVLLGLAGWAMFEPRKALAGAGMALGFTTPQYYRYVILPMAYRIIIPPLTSESMNIFKNSAVAFAVSIPELTQFYLQAGEETSAQIEIYIGVVILYVISAMTINRIMTFIERKIRVPGMVVATGSGGH